MSDAENRPAENRQAKTEPEIEALEDETLEDVAGGICSMAFCSGGYDNP